MDQHGYLTVCAAGCSDILQEWVLNCEVAFPDCEAPDLKNALVGDGIDVIDAIVLAGRVNGCLREGVILANVAFFISYV